MKPSKIAAVVAAAALLAGCASAQEDDPAQSAPTGAPTPSPAPAEPTATAEPTTPAPAPTVAAEPSQAMAAGCELMFDTDSHSVMTLMDRVRGLDLSSPTELMNSADELATEISARLETANATFPPEVQPYVATLQELFDLENKTAMTIGPWLADLASGAAGDALGGISNACQERGLEAL